MILTKTVTRAFPNANYVGFHLLLTDGVKIIIDKDYMEQWDGSAKMSDKVRDTIIARMQKDIDAYKPLAARHKDTGDDTVLTQVSEALKL